MLRSYRHFPFGFREFRRARHGIGGLRRTNQKSVTTVTRADGVIVTWTGADPNGYVIVSGTSLSAAGPGAGFNCTTRAGAGTFTVPAAVLLALPPSAILEEDGQLQPEGALQVGIAAPVVPFSAAGLGIAQATTSVSFPQTVRYK